MPFGLKMYQNVIQSKIDQTFEGCDGVAGTAGDIVVFGKTAQEHDCNMHQMLKRCEDTWLKFNPDKCFVKQQKIKLYGVVCGQDGIQPDPCKVSALQQMTPHYQPSRTSNLPWNGKPHGSVHPEPEYTDISAP